MSTTIAPPPTGPRTSARVIAILAIALGAVLVAGALVTGVFSTARAAAQHTETLTAASVPSMSTSPPPTSRSSTAATT